MWWAGKKPVVRAPHVRGEDDRCGLESLVDVCQRSKHEDVRIDVQEGFVSAAPKQVRKYERLDGCIQLHDRISIDEAAEVRDRDVGKLDDLGTAAGQRAAGVAVGPVNENHEKIMIRMMFLVAIGQGLRVRKVVLGNDGHCRVLSHDLYSFPNLSASGGSGARLRPVSLPAGMR